MMNRRALLYGLLSVPALSFGPQPLCAGQVYAGQGAGSVRLLMVEEARCAICRRWHQEVGPGYATSTLGRRAPLLSVGMDGPFPDGLILGARPRGTPTFILIRDGVEAARHEGYRTPALFYTHLARMLAE